MQQRTDHSTALSVATHPDEVDDQVLLGRLRKGDASAYGELWSRHHRRISLAIRPLAHAETEDIVSEAFLTVWAQVQNGGGPATAFRAYVLQTARNLAAKFHRAQRQVVLTYEPEALDLHVQPVASPEESIMSAEVREQVRTVFVSLPERWQLALHARYGEDVCPERAKTVLGVQGNAASALTRRAKLGFHRAWEDSDFAGPIAA